MKKILLLIVCAIVSLGMSAQVVKVYENGTLTATYTNTTNEKYKVIFEETENNIVKEGFSVSATKKVQFTKSNIYWDGDAYHFETKQTDYPTDWDENHVGHFYWINTKSYKSGNKNYMPYNKYYDESCMSPIDEEVIWCGESNKHTVDNIENLYALSNAEWTYLIYNRTNASKLYKNNVTVDGVYCLVIAPDNFSGTLSSSYTLAEACGLGLVCLPAAGLRGGSNLEGCGTEGGYWSSSYCETDDWAADNLFFYSKIDDLIGNFNRGYAMSIRLVRDMPAQSTNGQVINVFKNGKLVAKYTNTESNTYKVAFEEL